MGIYEIKPWFREQLQPAIKLLWNVHPDVLTWSALGLSVITGCLLWQATSCPWATLVAIPLLFARLAMNALDGMLAQQTGKARPAGELLNETTDRLADLSIFLGLAFCPAAEKPWAFLAIILILLVSYIGILGKAVAGQRIYSGVLGKADRLIYLMVACLIYGVAPYWTFFGLSIFSLLFLCFIPLAIATVIQRLGKICYILNARD